MRKEEVPGIKTHVVLNGQSLYRVEAYMPGFHELSSKTLMTIGDLVKVKKKYHAGRERRIPGWLWKQVKGKTLRINKFRVVCTKTDDYEVCVLVDTWIKYQAIVPLR